MRPDISIDADPQQREAAAPQVLRAGYLQRQASWKMLELCRQLMLI